MVTCLYEGFLGTEFSGHNKLADVSICCHMPRDCVGEVLACAKESQGEWHCPEPVILKSSQWLNPWLGLTHWTWDNAYCSEHQLSTTFCFLKALFEKDKTQQPAIWMWNLFFFSYLIYISPGNFSHCECPSCVDISRTIEFFYLTAVH